jgi:hypothetical protein
VGSGNYIERSALVAMPFFFMLIAAGITAIKQPVLKSSLTALVILASGITLVSYFARTGAWTVYKQNADWRSAVSSLRDQHDSKRDRTIVLAFSPSDELSYYDPSIRQMSCDEYRSSRNDPSSSTGDRDAVFVVRMLPDQCAGFTDDVTHSESAELLAIQNRFWLGNFEETMRTINADPRYRVEPLREYKGLKIYAIRF